ncbi:MAG TPA: hypothetical protein VI776_14865 [Anaerolineales bacterium]|nr:hypothetical protein [Anaerolineales bacterium]
MASNLGNSSSKRWSSLLISMLAALGLLLLAGWLDAFLLAQRKLAAASFAYPQLFLAQIGARSVLVAAWFALAWLVLFKQALPRLSGLLLMAPGLFVLLGTYLGLLAGLPIVLLRLNILFTDFLSLSGAFIAVLGLLVLASKPVLTARASDGDQTGPGSN